MSVRPRQPDNLSDQPGRRPGTAGDLRRSGRVTQVVWYRSVRERSWSRYRGRDGGLAFRLPDRPGDRPTQDEQCFRRDSAMSVPASATPLRVLVVDDYPDTTATLSRLVRLWGHDVRAALDGHAALEEARLYRPDVVILDIELPGMNGYDVARHLRALPGLEQVVLLCMTGHNNEAASVRYRETGFDHHFTKPADLDATVACGPEGLAVGRTNSR
jgi:CheY-like chemotaxis protein